MTKPNLMSKNIGKNVERIREIRGMRQKTLAAGLGISQQAVSKIEQSEELDEEMIVKIAEVLGVNVDAIKNFSEDKAIYNFQNNYENAANNVNYQNNPIEKITELYERLLESERQKNDLLSSMLRKFDKNLSK